MEIWDLSPDMSNSKDSVLSIIAHIILQLFQKGAMVDREQWLTVRLQSIHSSHQQDSFASLCLYTKFQEQLNFYKMPEHSSKLYH